MSRTFRGMPWGMKIQVAISFFIRVSLILAVALAAWDGRWTVLFISLATLILTFLPSMIERRLHIYLPLEFEVIIMAFIYATLYLGEVHDFYNTYWWWDVVLHGGSALVFGLIGFLIVYTLNHEPKMRIKLGPKFVFLFSFAFAMMIGAVWEIFEFGMDQLFGMNMQKSGLVDTMFDLIIDAIGAFIASLAGYLYIRRGEVPVFANAIENFVKDNPRMFKK